MAEAQQKEYQEIKELGRKANPATIQQIHEKHFASAHRTYIQEKTSQQQTFRQAFKKAFSGTKEQIVALWGFDPKTGLPPQRKPGEAPQAAQGPGVASPTGVRRNTGTGLPAPTTGAMEGGATAGSVGFKGAADNKPSEPEPKVVDGIIQDQ